MRAFTWKTPVKRKLVKLLNQNQLFYLFKVACKHMFAVCKKRPYCKAVFFVFICCCACLRWLRFKVADSKKKICWQIGKSVWIQIRLNSSIYVAASYTGGRRRLQRIFNHCVMIPHKMAFHYFCTNQICTAFFIG